MLCRCRYWSVIALAVVMADALSLPASAGRPVRGESRASVGGGNRDVNRTQSQNVNRNQNVNNAQNVNRNQNVNVNSNRDVNVNQNVNVNVNSGYGGGGYYGGGCCYHPVAAAVAVTATVAVTAAVVGSIVNSVPPSCTSVVVNGIGYQQCGSTWYQPQLSGSTTTYVVVNAPQ